MLKLAELNAVDSQTFTRQLGGVFEHSPWIAERTETKRPFRDWSDLFRALRDTVIKAHDDEKLALIRAHPDLVGKASLTRESQTEQAAAGLENLSAAEVAQFQKYNAEYRQKFGFPFVICARTNKKDAILAAFPQRLANSRETEVDT